jgi:hypothetical protein
MKLIHQSVLTIAGPRVFPLKVTSSAAVLGRVFAEQRECIDLIEWYWSPLGHGIGRRLEGVPESDRVYEKSSKDAFTIAQLNAALCRRLTAIG